ncbi:MAG: hypothetical protein GEEBNDBF_00143 [bacterium]|nr:hypothetical protein [bacterium]
MTSMAGAFQFDIDAASETADITPLVHRSGQAIGDLYFLNVDNFGVSLKVTGVGYQPLTEEVLFDYQVAHAFPAPSNPGGTASAGNRADLGISGRVVFLIDAPATVNDPSQPNHVDDYTFDFGDSTITMNAKAAPGAYCFYNPAGMLDGFHTPTNGTNAWPAMPLVQEWMGTPRIDSVTKSPISNGGSSLGNYAATNSWSTVAAWTGTTPTGYGVLHQGQTANGFIAFKLETGTSLSMKAVVIATYSDPRGGTSATQKRANRLPKGDTSLFAYRMPHGATDLEAVVLLPAGNMEVGATAGSTLPVTFIAVDQDHNATVGTGLTEIPNPSNIDSITMAAGELGAQNAVTVGLTGAGTWEDVLTQSGIDITNTVGTTGGVDNGAWVAVRVVDAQDSASAGLEQGLTLNNAAIPVPVTSGNEQHPVVYRAHFVTIIP